MVSKELTARKLELLKQEDVRAIVMDALHKRRVRYSEADNAGDHEQYKQMVNELKADYWKIIKKKE